MKGAERGMTSPLTILFRIFLTITGVIAAVGLCVRVFVYVRHHSWEGKPASGLDKVCVHEWMCVCVATQLKQWMTVLTYLRKNKQWVRVTLRTCETPGRRVRVSVKSYWVQVWQWKQSPHLSSVSYTFLWQFAGSFQNVPSADDGGSSRDTFLRYSHSTTLISSLMTHEFTLFSLIDPHVKKS